MVLLCRTRTRNICCWSYSELQRMSRFCSWCWSVHLPSVYKQPGECSWFDTG